MKLATFETVDKIDPIDGKDRIVLVTIKGFELVVQKDRFVVGDFCVYIPPDTIIDRSKPWFTSFRNDRVKTEKIAGVYSQGIILTLDDLKDIIPDFSTLSEEESENMDLGSLIGVSKYEKDLNLPTNQNKNKNSSQLPGFPIHLIPITDEENLKSVKSKYKHILMENELLNQSVNVTMKMDGTSTTLIWYNKTSDGKLCASDCPDRDGNVFIMASRNYSLYKDVFDNNGSSHNEFDHPDDKTKYIKNHKLMSRFKGYNIAIQGELCGPKIGGNKLGFDKHEFFVFTIRDLDTNEYFSYDEIKEFCEKNNLTPVPLLHRLTITLETDSKYFQDLADNVKYIHPTTNIISEGEGIVVRPDRTFNSKGLGYKNCSFKLINKKYKD